MYTPSLVQLQRHTRNVRGARIQCTPICSQDPPIRSPVTTCRSVFFLPLFTGKKTGTWARTSTTHSQASALPPENARGADAHRWSSARFGQPFRCPLPHHWSTPPVTARSRSVGTGSAAVQGPGDGGDGRDVTRAAPPRL